MPAFPLFVHMIWIDLSNQRLCPELRPPVQKISEACFFEVGSSCNNRMSSQCEPTVQRGKELSMVPLHLHSHPNKS